MEAIGARPATDALSPSVQQSSNCLNCGTPLYGVFCSSCGQRDIPPYPSLRELVIDAFWELSGWDGRFASTVRALVRAPGTLTREFLEGRRARYLSPLRLYLMSSLVYFLIAAAAPEISLGGGKSLNIGVTVGQSPSSVAAPSRPERVANETQAALESKQALPDSIKKKALEDISHAPKLMRPFLQRAIEDPGGLRRGLIEAMPKMLFALLPVFAAILAMLYRGKKYPEHFYFAIHLHSFMFFALSLAAAAKYTQLPIISIPAGIIAIGWIAVYSTMALRRVYGGSIFATVAKQIAIGAMYGTLSFVAFMTTIYVVSLQR